MLGAAAAAAAVRCFLPAAAPPPGMPRRAPARLRCRRRCNVPPAPPASNFCRDAIERHSTPRCFLPSDDEEPVLREFPKVQPKVRTLEPAEVPPVCCW